MSSTMVLILAIAVVCEMNVFRECSFFSPSQDRRCINPADFFEARAVGDSSGDSSGGGTFAVARVKAVV
jgi:hypothetical protein